jgi:hypothetical protein
MASDFAAWRANCLTLRRGLYGEERSEAPWLSRLSSEDKLYPMIFNSYSGATSLLSADLFGKPFQNLVSPALCPIILVALATRVPFVRGGNEDGRAFKAELPIEEQHILVLRIADATAATALIYVNSVVHRPRIVA